MRDELMGVPGREFKSILESSFNSLAYTYTPEIAGW